MNVITFGPPLAGKGTQSKRIIQDFGLTHLSTGDALRAEKAEQTALGIKAAAYSSKGLLAPDNLVSQIVEKFYHTHNGILFDGYPRNIAQAEHLLNVISKSGDSIDHVIFLKVAKEALLQRAVKRAEAENRADDKDSAIVLKRIDEFQDATIPAIQHIKASGIDLIEIDGNQSIDEIYNIIHNNLK